LGCREFSCFFRLVDDPEHERNRSFSAHAWNAVSLTFPCVTVRRFCDDPHSTLQLLPPQSKSHAGSSGW
jgi:hypothetical protein